MGLTEFEFAVLCAVDDAAKRQRRGSPGFVKGSAILSRVLRTYDLWSERREKVLWDETKTPDRKLGEMCQWLVLIVRAGQLLEGQGNFGDYSTDTLPSHPKFTDCRLTVLGEECLRRHRRPRKPARKKARKAHS